MGAIVFVGEGKGQEALKPFWKRLRSAWAKIKAVATDMASAYYAAVMKNLPGEKTCVRQISHCEADE